MLRRCSIAFAGNRQKMRQIAAAHIAEMKDQGTFKVERVITSPQSANITVANRKDPVLNFCANNYLGFANHPEVVKAAQQALQTKGFGMASVRFICGTQDTHKKLEQEITHFLGTEDTILYPSCFDANAGVFETILTEEDAIISDQLNHASIIDGVRLCKAKRFRYDHLNMVDLEAILQKTQDCRLRLIATDGVFSMDGDVAPLDQIVQLAEKYDANVFVDDSHATGFMGDKGKGTPTLFGVADKIDILNSTLGKALGGGSGGFSSGMQEMVTLQRNKGRPYLFSNTMAPCITAGCSKAIELLEHEGSALKRLQTNTRLFRTEMKKLGFTVTGHETCPIAPVMIGDAKKATEMANKMLELGIYVIGFSFPVVPKGAARIRVQLSAAHSEQDVRRCIAAFAEMKKSFVL